MKKPKGYLRLYPKYETSRFQFIDSSGFPDDMRQPYERAGYRRVDRYTGETTYLVYPHYFDEVIACGLDAKNVKKILRDKGILETDGDRERYQKILWDRDSQDEYVIYRNIERRSSCQLKWWSQGESNP